MCFNCGKKGHPSNHCTGKKKKPEDDDSKSVASNAASVRKLTNDLKKMKKYQKKNFATVNSQLNQLQEEVDESDLSNSEAEENSHFQVCVDEMQFTQFNQDFEPRVAKMLEQQHANKSKNKLELREVILLDSQSTMDFFATVRW